MSTGISGRNETPAQPGSSATGAIHAYIHAQQQQTLDVGRRDGGRALLSNGRLPCINNATLPSIRLIRVVYLPSGGAFSLSRRRRPSG
jgi:hypothetical protein